MMTSSNGTRVNSPHKGQWRGTFMLSLISALTNGWVNNRDAGDSRPHRALYDVTVMWMANMENICYWTRMHEPDIMRKEIHSVSYISWTTAEFITALSKGFLEYGLQRYARKPAVEVVGFLWGILILKWQVLSWARISTIKPNIYSMVCCYLPKCWKKEISIVLHLYALNIILYFRLPYFHVSNSALLST